jgi:hypothetical protein
MTRRSRTDAAIATGVVLVMFLIYNANGREIASYDSQPTKFAARELLLRGTTSLNHVVGRTPLLLERSGFQLARDGRYRSAYSPVPSIITAAIAWPFWKTGALDIRAPRAPALMAKLSSSLLVASTIALAYLIARRRLGQLRALFIAAALGLGTGLWSTASQTLWQHETAALGLMLAVFGLTRTPTPSAISIGVGLGLAASSRLQLVPEVVVLLAATAWIAGWRPAAVAAAASSAFIVPLIIANQLWFGTVLGATPMLESLHETVHGTSQSFSLQWEGAAGLLFSPNRGLFVFSPVVALATLGLRPALRDEWRRPVIACFAAATVEYLLYASYSVWWGGHTYGPRYLLDILPLLVPGAVIAAGAFKGRIASAVAGLTLAWSMSVAALGAFCYPHERWNSDPVDVDVAHDRLWDWRDPQILRAWRVGPSPQNYSLLTREAVRTSQGN